MLALAHRCALVGFVVAAAVLAPAAAQAAMFCVGKTGCPDGDFATLEQALAAANGSQARSDRDRIEMGPGPYAHATAAGFRTITTVDSVGAGRGQTIISSSGSSRIFPATLWLGADGSSLRSVS